MDPKVATYPGPPYIVTYTAFDGSENEGLARRRVYVYNPCAGLGVYPNGEVFDERPCISEESPCTVVGVSGIANISGESLA